MNFKFEHKFGEDLLEKLRVNIGKSLMTISAENGIVESTGQLILDTIQLDFVDSNGDNAITLKNKYEFYPIHGDELSNISVGIQSYESAPLGLINKSPVNINLNLSKSFRVKGIRIYGQHRIRKWSWDFTKSQKIVEGINLDEHHSDEIFTIEVIQLVGADDDRCIYFRSVRYGMEVTVSESVPAYFDLMYRKEDLDLKYNWLDDQDNSTNEKIYKEHYTIN